MCTGAVVVWCLADAAKHGSLGPVSVCCRCVWWVLRTLGHAASGRECMWALMGVLTAVPVLV